MLVFSQKIAIKSISFAFANYGNHMLWLPKMA